MSAKDGLLFESVICFYQTIATLSQNLYTKVLESTLPQAQRILLYHHENFCSQTEYSLSSFESFLSLLECLIDSKFKCSLNDELNQTCLHTFIILLENHFIQSEIESKSLKAHILARILAFIDKLLSIHPKLNQTDCQILLKNILTLVNVKFDALVIYEEFSDTSTSDEILTEAKRESRQTSLLTYCHLMQILAKIIIIYYVFYIP